MADRLQLEILQPHRLHSSIEQPGKEARCHLEQTGNGINKDIMSIDKLSLRLDGTLKVDLVTPADILIYLSKPVLVRIQDLDRQETLRKPGEDGKTRRVKEYLKGSVIVENFKVLEMFSVQGQEMSIILDGVPHNIEARFDAGGSGDHNLLHFVPLPKG